MAKEITPEELVKLVLAGGKITGLKSDALAKRFDELFKRLDAFERQTSVRQAAQIKLIAALEKMVLRASGDKQGLDKISAILSRMEKLAAAPLPTLVAKIERTSTGFAKEITIRPQYRSQH